MRQHPHDVRRYPDPAAVPYARTQPTGFPCQLTTQQSGRMYSVHHHGAWLNKEGNGNTDLRDGHFHRVVGFRVQPDLSDGHTHDLTMEPCGWGAPRTVGRDGQLPLQLGDTTSGGGAMVPAAKPPSMVPWLIGAVVVAGMVIGGVLIMRGGDE